MKINTNPSGLFAGLSLGLLLTFTSCSKSSDNPTTDEQVVNSQASAEADAEAEIYYDDVFNNVMGVNNTVGIGGTGVFQSANSDQPGALQSECFTVQVEQLAAPDSFPLKVTIDFGTTGCQGRDGRTRKGKIITVYTGRMVKPGSVAETSFDGYYVNDNKVEGTHRVENKSTSTQFSFETKVTNGKVTRPDGNYVEWNRTRLITQTDGWGTPFFPADDVFSITGSGSGLVKRGDKTHTWTTSTQEPLIKRFNCRWIVAGKKAVTRNDGPTAVIDFGTGDCDNKATLKVNGVSKEITLK
ncbi:hypothetical protein KJS94_09945 [Flavihumibacter rivuli]|uniref:hypothetical protein n=1 Tax=Flavihumibacter rivuli TaxID=2838156 RepID=UPI001BDF10F1|nr:hypothetical protein [Flavihumibacter rivuli]ULQ54959.1 hypothetical protein KJS94_09945 [Flavihumibacter rivuli]